MTFKPIRKETTVYEVVKQIEDNIISGKLKIGSKLPSERQMSKLLEVSRPVVREALIILKGKGLINMIPRKGNYINDFRLNGSLPILESLISFHLDNIEPKLVESLMATRKLIESETAALAAINKREEDLTKLNFIYLQEDEILKNIKNNNLTNFRLEILVDLDFSFHHLISVASGNLVYPLLLNSFKKVYTFLTSSFFNFLIKKAEENDLISIENLDFVIQNHKKLIESICKADSKNSKKIMIQILEHGEIFLRKYFFNNKI